MGWKERDWAKFDDAERRAFFGLFGETETRSASGTALTWLCVAAAVLGMGAYLVISPSRASSGVRPASPLAAPAGDVVAIRWRASDLAPAPSAGRICVTDQAHGRLCASYVVGERPADTLTRELVRQGLTVRSSG